MSAWLKDGESVRFTADDPLLSPLQRALAESTAKWRDAERLRPIGGTVAPTLQQIIDGDTDYTRRLNAKVENAWRDPK